MVFCVQITYTLAVLDAANAAGKGIKYTIFYVLSLWHFGATVSELQAVELRKVCEKLAENFTKLAFLCRLCNSRDPFELLTSSDLKAFNSATVYRQWG